jgi:Papain-like cysteine protease AvrRpt2
VPLRVKTGIPIRAPRRRAAAAPAVAPVMLDVPYVKQTQNQWCWAACTQMVAAFLDNPDVRQCELANFLHGRTNCCQQPGSDACNQPTPWEGVGPVYNHVNINCITNTWPVNPQVVVRELTLRRPVEVGLLWLGGGGHVVLIRGFTAQGLLAINDPWFGTGLCTYAHLFTAYGSGRWAITFGDFRNL